MQIATVLQAIGAFSLSKNSFALRLLPCLSLLIALSGSEIPSVPPMKSLSGLIRSECLSKIDKRKILVLACIEPGSHWDLFSDKLRSEDWLGALARIPKPNPLIAFSAKLKENGYFFYDTYGLFDDIINEFSADENFNQDMEIFGHNPEIGFIALAIDFQGDGGAEIILHGTVSFECTNANVYILQNDKPTLATINRSLFRYFMAMRMHVQLLKEHAHKIGGQAP